jgi:hypothetical protein
VRGILPPFDLHALALKVLIDGEKVSNFLQHVRINLGIVPDVAVTRIVLAYGEDLLVENPLVEHLKQADGAHLHHAAGKTRCIHQYQHIERVAIIAQGRWHKAVVAGVVHRGVEVAVEPEDVELLIVLVFVNAFRRDFDHDVEHFRRFFADGEFQIIRHR